MTQSAQLRGTIIENSLADKSILKSLHIERTRQSGSWTLHSVLVTTDQIPLIARALADGPWYVHFWEPGQDSIIVVYQDRHFVINAQNRASWPNAIAHGTSIGIPASQLDFRVV